MVAEFDMNESIFFFSLEIFCSQFVFRPKLQTLYFKWSALLTFSPPQCFAFVPAFPLQRSYNRLQVAILNMWRMAFAVFCIQSMYLCSFPQNKSYYPYCSWCMVFHFYPTQDDESDFCCCSVVDLLSLISSIRRNLGSNQVFLHQFGFWHYHVPFLSKSIFYFFANKTPLYCTLFCCTS